MSEALMREYYATYNSEAPDALAGFYHPEAELHSPGGIMRGADEILASYRYMISAFEDRMEPRRITMDENTASVDIIDRLVARQAIDDFLGVALHKGEVMSLELRGSYQIEDGRFRHIVIEPR